MAFQQYTYNPFLLCPLATGGEKTVMGRLVDGYRGVGEVKEIYEFHVSENTLKLTLFFTEHFHDDSNV